MVMRRAVVPRDSCWINYSGICAARVAAATVVTTRSKLPSDCHRSLAWSAEEAASEIQCKRETDR